MKYFLKKLLGYVILLGHVYGLLGCEKFSKKCVKRSGSPFFILNVRSLNSVWQFLYSPTD